jgi:hypothetical protein
MELINLEHDSPSFILAAKINGDLCDELIENIEQNSDKLRYDSMRGYHRLNDKDADQDLLKRYLRELNRVFQKYRKEFTFIEDRGSQWGVMSPYNLQKYDPGDCYRPIHIEQGGPREGKLIRNLAFVTYLNDIEEGGETEFPQQNMMIRPEKGLTTIFPAGWTHPHRGHPAPNEEKYIVTGWASYYHRC